MSEREFGILLFGSWIFLNGVAFGIWADRMMRALKEASKKDPTK